MLQNTVKVSWEILNLSCLKKYKEKFNRGFIWKEKPNECFSHLGDYCGTAYFLNNYYTVFFFDNLSFAREHNLNVSFK